MRETLIESCTEKVIAHAAENGGRCRLGLVKELVGKVSQRAPLLEITPDVINNRVRIIKGQGKEEEQWDVSPAIPFHIIRNPSLSTNSDLSVSASSNEQNPLDILASQAVTSVNPLLGLSFVQFTHNSSWLGYAKSRFWPNFLKPKTAH